MCVAKTYILLNHVLLHFDVYFLSSVLYSLLLSVFMIYISLSTNDIYGFLCGFQCFIDLVSYVPIHFWWK